MKEWTWREHAKLVKHHKALGTAEVWLSGESDDRPWQLVTSVEPGGTHRLEMSTSVWFRARDPKSGLTFRWSVDVEDRDANGHGYYKINTAKVKRITALLEGPGRAQWRAYLADSARKVQAKANEWVEILERQRHDAATLALLATEPAK